MSACVFMFFFPAKPGASRQEVETQGQRKAVVHCSFDSTADEVDFAGSTDLKITTVDDWQND